MGSVVKSGHPSGESVSILPHNAIDTGSIPALDAIFSIFITPMKLVAITMFLRDVQARRCMVV